MNTQQHLEVETTKVNRKTKGKINGEIVIYADVSHNGKSLNHVVADIFDFDIEDEGSRKGQVICRETQRDLKAELNGSAFLILKESEKVAEAPKTAPVEPKAQTKAPAKKTTTKK